MSKQVALSKFDLLRDFVNLKTLFPENFEVKSPPSEGIFSIKYSGKSVLPGKADWQRHEQFESIKACDDFTYGIWNLPEYFVTLWDANVG